MKTFQGYLRADGRVGIRNNVICMATANCVNSIVLQIADSVEGVIPMRHTDGCGDAAKSPYYERILTNLAVSPNIYGVILIGLECNCCDGEKIAAAAKLAGKRVFYADVKKCGGRQKVIEKAVAAARTYAAEAKAAKREEAPLSSLVIGTECGGSDAFSGITANPAIGYVSDWLISEGGTSILTEMGELIGCEKILADRATTPELAKYVYRIVSDMKVNVEKMQGLDSAGVSPGNMKGGLTTIQEKSLGCVNKGGISPVTGVIDYGERITDQRGLIIMDGTNNDSESLTGLFASGAQVTLFSSGRGSPLGFPCDPVIKICSNSKSFSSMREDVDLDAGAIINERLSVEEMGERCIKFLMEVINGKLTACERNRYYGPFGIAKKLFPENIR